MPPHTGMLGGVQQIGAGPFHITCCTISSSRVRAAAMPVPIPVSNTANQKRAAPEWASVEGIMSPLPPAVSFYRNTGANDIDIKPSIKRMNITVSKCFTSRVAPRNSFHTKTPQAAEIIVLPSPSENEVAGPTMGV